MRDIGHFGSFEGRAIVPSARLKCAVRRTDLLDTSEWAHKEMLRRLRKLTPEERIRMAFELSRFAKLVREAGANYRAKDRNRV